MDGSTLAPAAIAQVIVVWLIQKLKQAQWFPWLTQNSAKASRLVAYLVGLGTTVGITMQWMAAQRDLVIHVPTWQTLIQAAYTLATAAITNEITYMLVQIKNQTMSTGKEVGAPPIPDPPPLPVPDKPPVVAQK